MATAVEGVDCLPEREKGIRGKLRFSTRREAIRFPLRMFVEEASKRSQYSIASVPEGFKM